MKTLLIDASSLRDIASETIRPPFENLDYLPQHLCQWDTARLKQFIDAGLTAKYIVQKKGDMLYVPQGWLVTEICAAGHSMILGARKSYMAKSEEGTKRYELAVALYKASGRNVDRMEALLKLMQG